MPETTTTEQLREQVREQVRERYAAAAMTVTSGQGTASCCDDNCGDGGPCCGPTVSGGRRHIRQRTLCSRRTGTASRCQPWQPAWAAATPLPWRSSGRVRRCWTSARAAGSTCCCRRVGSAQTGFAYGVDMTDEMLDLARANAAQAGATNVEFLKGTIEDIPLPMIGGCGDQQLRDQPVRRQAEGDRRNVPGAQPRRPDRHQRCGGRGPPQRWKQRAERAPTSAASPERCPGRNTSTASPPPASPTRASVSPTRPPMACTAPSSKHHQAEEVSTMTAARRTRAARSLRITDR